MFQICGPAAVNEHLCLSTQCCPQLHDEQSCASAITHASTTAATATTIDLFLIIVPAAIHVTETAVSKHLYVTNI